MVNVSSFTSQGIGLSDAHFVDNNGIPYNDYSINALILFGVTPGETAAINLIPAIGVSCLQFISVGAGYDIGAKKVVMLLGIQYNFSK